MERSKYLTTGELARLAHVTKNTLFHYDKIGLFSPELVTENDYRYYAIHQIEVLNVIVMLRELGMSLKEIKSFLEGRSPQKLLTLLEKEEKQIQAQIEHLKERKRWIKEKQEKVENVLAVEEKQIYVRHRPETYYVLNHFENLTDAVYAEKIMELTEGYGKRNHGICYEIGNIQQMRDIQKGIYGNYQNVALIMRQKPKGMKYGIMPKGEYLITYFKGHWKNIGIAYRQMMGYAGEHGLKIGNHFLEIYAIDSLMAEQEEDYVTEISVQILSRGGCDVDTSAYL